jgi:hypothetical protein
VCLSLGKQICYTLMHGSLALKYEVRVVVFARDKRQILA